MIKLSSIKPNQNNPRLIKDDKFKKLVKSISEFPKMMSLRPIVVDENNIILGGNMRYKALQELGKKEIPKEWIKKASDLSDEEVKRFIIADNVGFGEWDEDVLRLDWNVDELDEWGLDLSIDEKIDNLEDGDEYEDLGIKQSIQVIPKNEYIIITEPEDSDEWGELKRIFKCESVRSGGCKVGSSSDKVGIGTERVFNLKTFKERVGL